MRALWLGTMGVAAAIVAAAACGGSDASPVTNTDAGGVVEPVTNDSAAPDAGPPPYTLDDVCDRTAARLCALRKPCCATYDEAGCIAQQLAQCAADVAATRAGEQEFHPERVETCVPTLERLYKQCTFTWELLQREGKNLDDCAIFTGKRPVDAGCERSAQCLPSGGPNDLTSCDDTTKRCKVISFLPEGASCALGDDIRTVCESGLYCDVDFVTFRGVCKKATSLGVACDTTKRPFQLECGLGNYCDLDSGRCTAGRPGGAPCNGQDLECASLSCRRDAGGPDGGACAPLDPIAKPSECAAR